MAASESEKSEMIRGQNQSTLGFKAALCTPKFDYQNLFSMKNILATFV